MPFWSAQQQNYQDTGGLAFSSGTSGYIQVTPQDGSSDTLDLPFLWWMPYQTHTTTFYWWEDYELSDGGSLPTESLNDLSFVRFTSYEDSDEFYYLLLPNLDPDPFLSFDSIYLESQDYNPTVDIPLLTSIISPEYEVNRITASNVGFEDILTFERPDPPQLEPEVPLNPPSPESPNSQDVPEVTSPLSLLLIGIILAASLLKRRLTCRMATQHR